MEILLTGNTGYITKEFIESAFPGEHIVTIGDCPCIKKEKGNITRFAGSIKEEGFFEIFEGYHFDTVVYFSNFLTLHGRQEGELERLRRVLKASYQIQVGQFIYLTSLEGLYEEQTGKTKIVSAAEHLAIHYANMNHMAVKILRLPFLYSYAYKEDYLYQQLMMATEKGQLIFKESMNQTVHFLCMEDLGDLLYRLCESKEEGLEIFNVPDCFHVTFGMLKKKIESSVGQLAVTYQNCCTEHSLPKDDRVLRERYGWFPKISILDDFDTVYHKFQMGVTQKQSKREKITLWLRQHIWQFKYIELAVGWFVIEYLNHLVGTKMQFKMIDLRLLFVVIMGTVYGMDMGIAAAVLETVALVGSYQMTKNSWMTLFYEPRNWLSFTIYFIAGAICGYVRLKSKNELLFLKEEKELLQEKFLFIKKLYQDSLQEKKRYKKQIIGSRDSFGKIFEVTRQLDVTQPEEVFNKAINVLEDVLENSSISIYTVGSVRNYGRLEAASKSLINTLPKSVLLSDYQLAKETLNQGEVWINTNMVENYPMYMAEIGGNIGKCIIIMIHHASYMQMGLYYVNLIKILCGLIESSMMRALEHQELVREEEYITGTDIMKEQYFVQKLRIRHGMREQRIADYMLLQIDRGNMTLEQVDGILRTKIRENDILGIGEDQNIYLLMAQVNKESIPCVLERLENGGLKAIVVE